MAVTYRFTTEEAAQVIGQFGQPFVRRVEEVLVRFAQRWRLSSFQLIPSFSAHLVFSCVSETHGAAVLKIAPSANGVAAEHEALLHYKDDGRWCRLLEADVAGGVLLLARVLPGTSLRRERSLENRLSVFCALYKGLHRPPGAEAEGLLSTYTDQVNRIAAYMARQTDGPALKSHMQRARELCASLAALYPRRLLLHGDLHHDNMLLAAEGRYVIIDPKGVMGDPFFDIPRFVLNELNELNEPFTATAARHVETVIRLLARKLDIPLAHLGQGLYVERVMSVCWEVEDGASPERCRVLVAKAACAEAIMQATV